MDAFDAKVQRLRERLLNMAQAENIEPDVLLNAACDVIGVIAVGMNRTSHPLPIAARLQQVVKRVTETHDRISGIAARQIVTR